MKYILTIFCVVFLALGASALTIRDIQYTDDTSGDSPYEGQTVTVSGVVTRALSNSAYLQDDTTAWSGILIYGVNLKSGDSITITAKVDEYNTKTELTEVVDYTVHKTNAGIPGPVEVLTDSVNHEKWEGVFVVCNDIEVTDVSGNTFEIDDGSGPLQVYTGNYNISYSPAVGDSLMFVRGPIDVYYGTYQLLPLRDDDILEAISGTGGARINPKYSEANSVNDYRIDVYATVDSSYGYVDFIRVRFDCDTLMDLLEFELDGAGSMTIDKDTVRGRITVDIDNAMLTDTVSLRINNYYFAGKDSSGNALADTFTVYTGESPAYFQTISSLPVISLMPDKDIMTIREVQSTSDGYNSMYRGQLVTVRGRVSGSSDIFSPLPGYIGFYLQDETGGVNIFSREDESGNVYRRGIELIITGTVTEYNGLTEIEYSDPSNDMIIVNDTIAEVEPEILARSQGVSELNEGSLLKAEYAKVITSPVSAGTGKNFQAYNGQTLLDVRITDKSPFYNSQEIKSIKEGMLVNITGIGGQYDTEEPYNTGYQLMIRDGDDIEFIETDEDSNFTLTILPNPVAFENGETARIIATALNEERITVKIFDLAGRPVTVLGENLPGSNTLIWDGRNKLGEYVTPAAYIITVDKTGNNGKTVRIVKPIVVTTELN